METVAWSFEASLAAKEARRKELAHLPIEKKVEILYKLQEMTAPILCARGIHVVPWKVQP
jgi:hypothetical protein